MRIGPTLAVLTVVTTAAHAQQDRQVPTFRTGVNAVLVDVVALDAKGNPVSGLGPNDFQVFEDGVPQTIATFDVTDWTSYVGARTDDAPPEGNVNTYPRRFIFVVNRQGAEFEYLTRAKRDLQSFIVESLAEGDEAMVVDVGYSTKVAQQFHAGKEETLEAVRKLSQMRIDYPMGPDRAAGQLYRDLESLGESLLSIPGRKILILFSNELLTFPPPGSRASNESFSLKRAVDALNQANVSVYTLDIRGADSFGTSIEGGLSPLATETKGRYFRNNPSFGPPLQRIGQENQRYYLLSYVSTNPEADGSYRKIEVKVARDDVTVIARPGYFAREPSTRTTEGSGETPSVESKPTATVHSRAELPMALELTTYLLPTGHGAVRVPVSVALPEDLLSGKGGSDRKLALKVTDAGGRTVQSFEEPVSLERFFVMRNLELEPGSYLLQVTVSSSEQELHRASTALDIPQGLGERFGLSSLVPVVSPEASKEVGSDLPILPVAAVARGEDLHVLFQVFAGNDEPREKAAVSYRVFDEGGGEVLSARVENEISLNPSSGGTPVILSVPTRALAFGRYRVEVRVEDPSSGRGAAGEIEFRVR